MPKSTTPYDTLWRVRRIEEDKAKAELAAANNAHRQAQTGLDSRRTHYSSAVVSPDGEMDLAAFRGRLAHTTAAAQAVGWARAEVENSEQARLAAVEATRQASMRTQGLERLVERAKKAREQELLAADQRTAEESMTGKRARNSASSSSERAAAPGGQASKETSALRRRRGDR